MEIILHMTFFNVKANKNYKSKFYMTRNRSINEVSKRIEINCNKVMGNRIFEIESKFNLTLSF